MQVGFGDHTFQRQGSLCLPQLTPQTSSTNFSQTLSPGQSNTGETKSIETVLLLCSTHTQVIAHSIYE